MFFGNDLVRVLTEAVAHPEGATVFAYRVNDPQRYGVVEFTPEGRALGIVEKPQTPRSNWAVTGLYVYDNDVVNIAAQVKPSARGEIEITDVNAVYLRRETLRVRRLGRGFAWLDMGTAESLLQASLFVQTIEARQGLKICCPEEIAYRHGWISAMQVRDAARKLSHSAYGAYLSRLLEDNTDAMTEDGAGAFAFSSNP
ncbi:MAG: glucose-1-phosphate thymidylyltransferase [Rhodospirillaceae bacterium]|nr:MAG: glucose-1-phosphate thymidylyltransferase [Rhodospirillaceae bacterium]